MVGSKELVERLPIIDENVLAEAAKQPLLFIDAARYRVAKMRKRAQADAALDFGRAQLGIKIRGQKTEERTTEGAIKAQIDTSKVISDMRAALNEAEAEEEFSKLILEAYRYRRDAIRILAEAHVYEGIRESSEIQRIETRRKLSRKARELEDKRSKLRE